MKIGFVGLGKMGQQIVKKLLDDDHQVVVYDVDQSAVSACQQFGAEPANSREDLLAKLPARKIIWLMIPAQFVETEINHYLDILPSGSLLIDGGNSFFKLSIEHAKKAAAANINFIDVGTSGGILGLKNGFSLMVGGQKTSYEEIIPLLKTMAAPNGGYNYMGESGAGHYVKMVHNGIEYAMMQAYAEGYDLLKYGPMADLDLAAVADVWQKGSIIKSDLNSLIHQILAENPELNGILGQVDSTGEGQWTYDTAQQSKINMPGLKAALDVRAASQEGYDIFATKLLAMMRSKFGGHNISTTDNNNGQ